MHIIKPNESFPIGISALGQFEMQTLSSTLNAQSADFIFYSYGGFLYRAFQVDTNTFLQPSVIFSLTSQLANGSPIVLQQPMSLTEIAVPIVLKSEESQFIIEPSIGLSKNEPIYSVHFLFIFVFSNKN